MCEEVRFTSCHQPPALFGRSQIRPETWLTGQAKQRGAYTWAEASAKGGTGKGFRRKQAIKNLGVSTCRPLQWLSAVRARRVRAKREPQDQSENECLLSEGGRMRKAHHFLSSSRRHSLSIARARNLLCFCAAHASSPLISTNVTTRWTNSRDSGGFLVKIS